METVTNPCKLFRTIDATGFEDDRETYTFHVSDEQQENATRVSIEEVDDDIDSREEKVYFRNLNAPDDEFLAAYNKLQDAATEVDSVEDIDAVPDASFQTSEGAIDVTYYVNTDLMGYKVTRNEDPLIAGYVVISPDTVYKVAN